jgi:hypothetical protein
MRSVTALDVVLAQLRARAATKAQSNVVMSEMLLRLVQEQNSETKRKQK